MFLAPPPALEQCFFILEIDSEIDMRIIMLKKLCVAMVTVFILGACQSPSANDLGDVLRDSKWDRFIGSWITGDKGDGEDLLTQTWVWKIENRMIEVTTVEGAKRTVALIGLNQQGEVINMGLGNDDSAWVGGWAFTEAQALLTIHPVGSDNKDHVIRLYYHYEGNNALSGYALLGDNPKPIDEFTMTLVSP